MLFVLERGNSGQRPERYRKGVRELEKDGMKKRECEGNGGRKKRQGDKSTDSKRRKEGEREKGR